MEQVALNIIPRLPYSGENFVIHEGVSDPLRILCNQHKSESFSITYVYGPERFGKTHLLVKYSYELSKEGIFHRVNAGPELGQLAYELQVESSERQLPRLVLIDDLDLYLLSVIRGQSGEFVSFVEWCRLNRVGIVFFSSRKIDEFPSDDHVKSRLRAAIQLEIGSPSDSDMATVLQSLAKQRGVKLNSRNINFLSRRLGRDLPSLERYVDRLLHLSQVLGKSIKFDLVSDAL